MKTCQPYAARRPDVDWKPQETLSMETDILPRQFPHGWVRTIHQPPTWDSVQDSPAMQCSFYTLIFPGVYGLPFPKVLEYTGHFATWSSWITGHYVSNNWSPVVYWCSTNDSISRANFWLVQTEGMSKIWTWNYTTVVIFFPGLENRVWWRVRPLGNWWGHRF